MPIIYMPSAVGGAGDAAAAVTQQLNFGMQQQLQLLELQERRKLAQLEMLQQERQFAARMGMAGAQFAEDMAFRQRGFVAERDDAAFARTMAADQFGLAKRQLDREEARDEEVRARAARDEAFRERQFGVETGLALQQLEQRGRLADAEIAQRQAQTGAFIAEDVERATGVAARVAHDLDNRFQVSGDGLLFLLQDLQQIDAAEGTTFAQEADSLLRSLTGGEYDNVDPFALQARLQSDPRLPRMFTAAGQVALRAKTQQRASQRASELTSELGALTRRVEALGDKRVTQEFDDFWATRLPAADADAETLLDYADNSAATDLRAWQDRVTLEETRMAARGALDALKGRLGPAWHTEPMGETTKGERFSKIAADLERAETLHEVRAAQAQAAILLDPNAKLAADYMARLAGARPDDIPQPAGFTGEQPFSVAERGVIMRALQERYEITTPEELEALYVERGGEMEAFVEEVRQRIRSNQRASRANAGYREQFSGVTSRRDGTPEMFIP